MLFITFFLTSFAYFLSSKPVAAQCPVCIVTVGGGMILAQKLGIDDLLVSIWISGLNTALAYWLAPKLKVKFIKKRTVLSFVFYLFTLLYFQTTGQLGLATNSLLGIDKILLGQTIGLIAMISANLLYAHTKDRNHHKTIFPYAKVVFPLSFLLLATLFLKFGFNL